MLYILLPLHVVACELTRVPGCLSVRKLNRKQQRVLYGFRFFRSLIKSRAVKIKDYWLGYHLPFVCSSKPFFPRHTTHQAILLETPNNIMQFISISLLKINSTTLFRFKDMFRQ